MDLVAAMVSRVSESGSHYFLALRPTPGTRTLKKYNMSPHIEPTVTRGPCGQEKQKKSAKK